jgi:hypothetical protein
MGSQTLMVLSLEPLKILFWEIVKDITCLLWANKVCTHSPVSAFQIFKELSPEQLTIASPASLRAYIP